MDVKIPSNRPSWAMSLAFVDKLLATRNIPLDVNDLLAISLKESHLGCDANAQDVEYKDITAAAGCFQFQGPGTYTAWAEMQKMYPKHFQNKEYENLVPGDKFETSTVLLAYYLSFAKAMFAHRDWQVQNFINNSQDKDADIIIYALAYNRGLWSEDLTNILEANRDFCLNQQDLTECISDPEGKDYAQEVSNYSAALKNSSTYYNKKISWSDIDYFINRLKPIYSQQNFTKLKKETKIVFRAKDKQHKIDFQKDFDDIVNIIIANLPSLTNPWQKINKYNY